MDIKVPLYNVLNFLLTGFGLYRLSFTDAS